GEPRVASPGGLQSFAPLAGPSVRAWDDREHEAEEKGPDGDGPVLRQTRKHVGQAPRHVALLSPCSGRQKPAERQKKGDLPLATEGGRARRGSPDYVGAPAEQVDDSRLAEARRDIEGLAFRLRVGNPALAIRPPLIPPA